MRPLLALLLALALYGAPAYAESIWFKVELSDVKNGQPAETFYLRREVSQDGTWGPWQRYTPSPKGGFAHSYNFTSTRGGRAFDNRAAQFLEQNLIAAGKWKSFVEKAPATVETPIPVEDSRQAPYDFAATQPMRQPRAQPMFRPQPMMGGFGGYAADCVGGS